MSPRIKLVFKLAATIAILGLLIRFAGPERVVGALRETNPLLLLPMYALVVGRALLQSMLTYDLLKRVGAAASVTRVFLANALASFYGLVVPGDIAASFAKWRNLSIATGQKAAVLNAILYQKLLLIMISLVIGLLALLLENPMPQLPIRSLAACFLAVSIFCSVLMFSARAGRLVDPALLRITRTLPTWLQKRADSVLSSLNRFRSLSVGDHVQFAARAFMVVGFMVASFAVASYAQGLDLPLSMLVWLQVMLLLIRTLPITVGNLGVREALLVAVLVPLGIEASTAIAFGLLLFTRELLIAIVGGLYQASLLLGWTHAGPLPTQDPAPTTETRTRLL